MYYSASNNHAHPSQTEILEILRGATDGMTTKEVAKIRGKRVDTTRSIIQTLAGDGKVYKKGEKWYAGAR